MRILRTALLAYATVTSGVTLASHDESLGARFVQPGGVDAGNCLDHDAPCISVPYALRQAEAGNTVKVGAGVFDLSGLDPEGYLYGPVRATGGYDDDDHYFESRPGEVQSVITGVDARYRNALAVRGFYWADSAAAAARGEITFGGGVALQSAQAASATCTQGLAGQFPCRNIEFLAQIPLSGFSSRPVSAANVWGFVDLNDNREYAVIGLRNGTAIVDVTDPVNPREVTTIAGNSSPWREVKVYQVRDAAANRWRAYAYVTTEAANSGLQVIDMSGLPQSAALASTNMDTGSQHTLYISNIDYTTNVAFAGREAFLYVAGSNLNGGSWRAYSLANPAAPQFITGAPTSHYMHDSTSLLVTDPRANQCAPGHNPCEVLFDFDVDQIELWDVTDKAQPFLLSTATNPNNHYIHSGWPSTGGYHLFFHDELEEIRLGRPTNIYTLDLSNLRSPGVTGIYQGATTSTDHNGYTRGIFYYVAHYRRGLVIFDVNDPTQLAEVGHFDNYLTPAANTAGTDGTWGVYPFLPGSKLLVSDIENGLFVLRTEVPLLDIRNGRLGFTELEATVTENAGSAQVRVQRVGGRMGEVSIQYTTSAGSATEAADYSLATGTLSWGHRDMADKIITIGITDDAAVEGLESFTVTLSAPTGFATIDGSSSLVVTLADNDAAPPSGGGGGGGSALDLMLLLCVATLLHAHRNNARYRIR